MAKIFSLVFTGLSGSGKTTLAKAVSEELKRLGVHCQFIDGDDFREEIGSPFGYSYEERMKNNGVVRAVIKYLNKNGVNVIFTLVAPYEKMRQAMRENIGAPYIEVYAKCPATVCARRDVKGYYKKQQQGGIKNLNGADDVYEEPVGSDIVVDTEHDTKSVCVDAILRYLRENGYIEYKYITENNTENRQDYMYSDYHGEEFLSAYKKTRQSFVASHPEARLFIPPDDNANGRLVKLTKRIEAGEWTADVAKELDFFVKAFEVRKRLYDEYQPESIRPKDGAAYDCAGNYLLLALSAYRGYTRTKNLKYLNVMLKLDDTLMSLEKSLTPYEASCLSALLRAEAESVERISSGEGLA